MTSRRLRLLYIVNARLPTERAHGLQIVKMCEAFARNGHSVELWHPLRRQADPALERTDVFEFYGVPATFHVESLPNIDIIRLERLVPRPMMVVLQSIQSLWWGSRAAKKAATRATDLHFTRDVWVAFWLVRRGLPTIYESHDVRQRLGRWLLRRTAPRPSLCRVIALNDVIASRLAEVGVPRDKLEVVLNGVDLEAFEVVGSRSEVRATLELPTTRAIVAYVGRFTAMGQERGLPELVQAMAHLGDRSDEPLLVGVGGPPETIIRYQKLATRSGLTPADISLRDRVPSAEVPLWLRAADVLVIPWPRSRFSELFVPLKVFEYMASGTPIVATDLPPIAQVLRHGHNALLVPPGDYDAMATAIGRLLDDPGLGGKLADNAAADVRSHTWQQRASRILDPFQAGADR